MKKNIVFRSGSLRMGGLERILIEVLQNINKKKYEITLIIDDDCGIENVFENEIPKEIKYFFLKPEKLIRVTEFFKKRKQNIFFKIMYNIMMFVENKIMYIKMSKFCMGGKIDVLIDFDAGASKYIYKLKNIDKKVVWIHNSIPSLKKRKDKIKRFGNRLKQYDKIVAICDEMKEELEEVYPFLKGNVIRIYNPFNFKRIKNLSNDISGLLNKEKKLLEEDFFVMISRIDAVQKDYTTLLKAFSYILTEKREMKEKLYIIGDGPDKEKIENLIKELNLENSVKLIGFTKNPYIWIKNSNFLIHSSKYEGLPTVLIEALICGKAVLSSDCATGPKEILGNGKYGRLFQVGNINELAINLKEFLNNKDLVKKYEEMAEIRKNDFDSKVIIKEYERLIDTI